jgi:hypothetical protein
MVPSSIPDHCTRKISAKELVVANCIQNHFTVSLFHIINIVVNCNITSSHYNNCRFSNITITTATLVMPEQYYGRTRSCVFVWLFKNEKIWIFHRVPLWPQAA